MSNRGEPSLMKGAAWIAGILAFGWLITAGVAVTMPGGHPPGAYFAGSIVVLLSFVMAPIGAGAALVELRRALRHAARPPRLAVAALGLNALFLVVAIALWLWISWAASRR
jgi:hypothetical protein